MNINLWVESSIATDRVLSNFLNDISSETVCTTRTISDISWKTLHSSLNIFSRAAHPNISWIPAYLKRNNISYIYYLDDNFWRIQGNSELAKFYQSKSTIDTLDEFVRHASLIIVNSPSILEFIATRFPEAQCELLPPPFDSELADKHIQPKKRASSNFVVGYAGSYKATELEIIEKSVLDLCSKRPDIRFEFIGGITERLRGLNNVQWFPGFDDYHEFIKFKISRQWDLGLAPLLDSPFNASKTNNKFREYGGCGIVGLYSNVSPYRESVIHRETGYLTNNDVASWTNAIVAAAENPAQRLKISAVAKGFVKKNYSHQAIAPLWMKALKKAPPARPELGLSTTQRMRLNYIKFHHQTHSPSLALQAETANQLILYKRRLYELFRYIFTITKAKKLSIILLGLLAALTLINLNIYLVREILS
ncbi:MULTISPECIES: glycosyltransferase [unclassified Pseudomonas]|uniref:glycosyltransferase n=1 Tax=unclassified Pseudomonas TaxID=196821 RepID=UPI00244CCE0C|nr:MULTISPECIES: glycosyltransferase [unclassified Pseudomonas]MDG9925376.1 glycosyltransferase [Pseudomonas sp. GD04045]MDH0037284.1 glycosyltransferase [Pseudomonas sp. GD04019]